MQETKLDPVRHDVITREAAFDIYAARVRERLDARPLLQADIDEDGKLREATIRAKAAASKYEAEGWARVIDACDREGWTVDVAMSYAPCGLSTEEMTPRAAELAELGISREDFNRRVDEQLANEGNTEEAVEDGALWYEAAVVVRDQMFEELRAKA